MRHFRVLQRRSSVGALTFVALAVTVIAQPAHAGEPLKIKASLSGYNLIWPTSRCCAFDLVVGASGKGAVIIHDKRGDAPRDKTVQLELTSKQVDALVTTITSNEFFSLPASVGDMPIDDDVRKMEIEVGSKRHKVELNGWPVSQETLASYDTKKRKQVTQAAAVWVAIRQVVTSSEVSLP
jgi:hypothetical protein